MPNTANIVSWLSGTPSKGDIPPSYFRQVSDKMARDSSPPSPSPSTPAPSIPFAIRGFTSRLFGTPQPSNDLATQTLSRIRAFDQAATTEPASPSPDPIAMRGPTSFNESPQTTRAAPAGILVTPGTATARRKTVSFGEDIVGKDPREVESMASRSGLPPDCPGKFPSPWSVRSARTTPLTKTLLAARTVTCEDVGGEDMDIAMEEGTYQSAVLRESFAFSEQETPRTRIVTVNEADEEDTTIDLDRPRSTSGKYWKASLDTYANGTAREMKKLVKYKELAKAYAKKKDAEAAEFSERLREERKKVERMEKEVKEMEREMRERTVTGPRREGGSPEHKEMLKKLETQRILARGYREEVECFAKEMVRDGGSGAKNEFEEELRTAREELKNFRRLRVEIDDMKEGVGRAEKQAERAKQENRRLADELEEARAALRCQSEKERDREMSRQHERECLESELRRRELVWSRELRAAKEETSDVRMETVALRKELRESNAEIRRLKRQSQLQHIRIAEDIDITPTSRRPELTNMTNRFARPGPSTSEGHVLVSQPSISLTRPKTRSGHPETVAATSVPLRPRARSILTGQQISSVLGHPAASRALRDLTIQSNYSQASLLDADSTHSYTHLTNATLPGHPSRFRDSQAPQYAVETVTKDHSLHSAQKENSLRFTCTIDLDSSRPMPTPAVQRHARLDTATFDFPSYHDRSRRLDEGTYDLPMPSTAKTNRFHELTRGLNGTDTWDESMPSLRPTNQERCKVVERSRTELTTANRRPEGKKFLHRNRAVLN